MAGLGRRTHYRKHLTDQVLFDLPIPNDETEQVGKIVATRGSNQFDVLLSDGKGSIVLAILPTKFRKLVWLKRNDFVIVESGIYEDKSGKDEILLPDDKDAPFSELHESAEEEAAERGGIRFMIKHILYKDQIRNLIEKEKWPEEDREFQTEVSLALMSNNNKDTIENNTANLTESSDGIVYDVDYNDDTEDNDYDLFVNTNRVAALQIDDSSSSEEDE